MQSSVSRELRRSRFIRFVAGLPIGCSALSGVAFAQVPDSTSEGLEDIVVTATKREENLQKVPVAVTAITAEAISANRIQNIRDLNALAPGLLAQPLVGGGQAAAYTLRGIRSAGASPGTNTGVATYVDGVYQGATSGAIVDIADIERIEVLRGPQGTLFGRNSNGGAISITTRNPSGEFGVHQELTYGNYDHFRSKTRVDLPALGWLNASVTYVHNERRGDVQNLGAGTRWDYSTATDGRWGIRTSPKFLGNENSEGLFAALHIDPGSGIDILYKFDYSENDFTDNGTGLIYLGAGLNGLYNTLVPAAQRTPITQNRPKAVNNNWTTPGHLRVYGHNLTTNWDIDDTFTVKNIFAYRDTKLTGTGQIDGLGGMIVPPGLISPVAVGAIVGTVIDTRFHQYTNETQLNVDTDWFEITAGFFISHDVTDTGPPVGGPLGGPSQAGTQLLLNGTQPYVVARAGILVGQQRTHIVQNSKAIFLSGNFHITDQLDLTVGIRQTWDRKYGVDNTNTPLKPSFRYDFHSDKPTWSVGTNYRFTPDVMAYAKVSSGFISGGRLGGVDFEPETVVSYEAGLKAELFDRTLRTNIAAYLADYDNLQFPAQQNGLTVLLNAGKSRAKGVEFEATYQPVRAITLQGNVGYLDFKYISLDPELLAFKGFTREDQLLVHQRPKITASGSIQYETPEMPWGGNIVARADATYRSKILLTDIALLPGSLQAIQQGSLTMLNGRLSFTDLTLGPVKGTVALWGRNLTNNHSVSFSAGLGQTYAAVYERARTYGVDLIIDF